MRAPRPSTPPPFLPFFFCAGIGGSFSWCHWGRHTCWRKQHSSADPVARISFLVSFIRLFHACELDFISAPNSKHTSTHPITHSSSSVSFRQLSGQSLNRSFPPSDSYQTVATLSRSSYPHLSGHRTCAPKASLFLWLRCTALPPSSSSSACPNRFIISRKDK